MPALIEQLLFQTDPVVGALILGLHLRQSRRLDRVEQAVAERHDVSFSD